MQLGAAIHLQFRFIVSQGIHHCVQASLIDVVCNTDDDLSVPISSGFLFFVPLAAALGHLASFLWFLSHVGESSRCSASFCYYQNFYVSNRWYLLQSNNFRPTHAYYRFFMFRPWEDQDQFTCGPQVGPSFGQMRSRYNTTAMSTQSTCTHHSAINLFQPDVLARNFSTLDSRLCRKIIYSSGHWTGSVHAPPSFWNCPLTSGYILLPSLQLSHDWKHAVRLGEGPPTLAPTSHHRPLVRLPLVF